MPKSMKSDFKLKSVFKTTKNKKSKKIEKTTTKSNLKPKRKKSSTKASKSRNKAKSRKKANKANGRYKNDKCIKKQKILSPYNYFCKENLKKLSGSFGEKQKQLSDMWKATDQQAFKKRIGYLERRSPAEKESEISFLEKLAKDRYLYGRTEVYTHNGSTYYPDGWVIDPNGRCRTNTIQLFRGKAAIESKYKDWRDCFDKWRNRIDQDDLWYDCYFYKKPNGLHDKKNIPEWAKKPSCGDFRYGVTEFGVYDNNGTCLKKFEPSLYELL
jgi:hypothetical protein